MDPFHARLARLALAVAAEYGFALAGGYAVQLHGLGDRPSKDVDLFTPDMGGPARAAELIAEAYRRDGLTVTLKQPSDTFARLWVNDKYGNASKVELGVDWRAHSPVRLEIGPVLHLDDAVANKVVALFSRWAARDFLDVDAALLSGLYSREDLMRLAADHDLGFDRRYFADALSQLNRIPDQEFADYGLDEAAIAELRERFTEWHHELVMTREAAI